MPMKPLCNPASQPPKRTIFPPVSKFISPCRKKLVSLQSKIGFIIWGNNMNVTFEDTALEELYLQGKMRKTHPGELVRDELRERGLTQRQLAAMAGLKPTVISEVVRAQRSVTEEIAASLEKALGIPAAMWMNLQSQYDHDTAAMNVKRENVVVTIPVSDRNLLRDLSHKFGWVCML